MESKDWFFAVVEVVICYFFIYYLLSSIKGGVVNLWVDALVLVVLAYLGTIISPWFRKTNAWRRLFKE